MEIWLRKNKMNTFVKRHRFQIGRTENGSGKEDSGKVLYLMVLDNRTKRNKHVKTVMFYKMKKKINSFLLCERILE